MQGAGFRYAPIIAAVIGVLVAVTIHFDVNLQPPRAYPSGPSLNEEMLRDALPPDSSASSGLSEREGLTEQTPKAETVSRMSSAKFSRYQDSTYGHALNPDTPQVTTAFKEPVDIGRPLNPDKLNHLPAAATLSIGQPLDPDDLELAGSDSQSHLGLPLDPDVRLGARHDYLDRVSIGTFIEPTP